jgi:hypothetical protein
MLNVVKVKYMLKEFLDNQDAAVTVDFVVITAGVVLIAAAATTTLISRVSTAVNAVSLP